VILKFENLKMYYNVARHKLFVEMEEFQGRGSGWVLHRVNYLELRIN
jgi:hypothetical protein